MPNFLQSSPATCALHVFYPVPYLRVRVRLRVSKSKRKRRSKRRFFACKQVPVQRNSTLAGAEGCHTQLQPKGREFPPKFPPKARQRAVMKAELRPEAGRGELADSLNRLPSQCGRENSVEEKLNAMFNK